MKKQKIAVLGGGLGALTTAFELTNDPNWKDRYESITVYQMGWRLGGKGASGRNPDLSNRIEEHGLHVFMGFYDNAFHMMKALYKECLDKNLTPNSPFATARDAFSKLNLVVLTDRVGNRWELWPHSWTESEEFPGSEQPLAGGVKPFILELALLAADRVIEALPVPGDLRTALLNTARMLAEGGVTKLLANLVVRASTALSDFLHKTLGMPHLAGLVHPAAHTTLRAAGAGRREPASNYEAQLTGSRDRARSVLHRAKRGENILDEELRTLVTNMDRTCRFLLRALRSLVGELDSEVRRSIIAADLALTVARGMIEDGLLDGDFEKIDHLDLSEWIRGHGSLFEGRDVLTRSLYDATFAYQNGDRNRPNLSAGAGLYAALRLVFTYRGAIMWRMGAGMGDTIFTPLYQVLRARGVQFEFFQKVTNLGLSADKSRVETIEIDVQAEVKPGRNGSYDPLQSIKTTEGGVERTLLCWPDRPNYSQLIQGEEMKKKNLLNPDIESYWTDWKPTPEIKKRLEAGKDFDLVVLGISLGALPFVCKELIAPPGASSTTPNVAALRKWRAMVDDVKTVRTQGFQLWLNRTSREMGLDLPAQFTDKPLLCGFVEPFDTWCDMTHLIARESFKDSPKQVAYFCNAAPVDMAPPDFSDHEYPKRQREKALAAANDFLDTNARTIWKSCMDKLTGKFDRQRVVQEYFRLNVDPPEQYVLSVPGSRRSRMKPGESGFQNVLLAGDWTRCIVDVGCVEGAVISGKFAAAAIMRTRPAIFGLIGAKWEEI